jgi:hypothetical protein
MEEPEPKNDTILSNPDDWKMPSLSYGCNPAVPSFSSAIDVDHSEQFGRHVVANRNIKTGAFSVATTSLLLLNPRVPLGDVLIIEECIISSMSLDRNRDYCKYCFKICYSVIPCKFCGLVSDFKLSYIWLEMEINFFFYFVAACKKYLSA